MNRCQRKKISDDMVKKNNPLKKFITLIIVWAVFLTACSQATNKNAETVTETNYRAYEIPEGTDTATFAGGCFWCTEAVFERVNGVEMVISGYSGGKQENANYDLVSYGKTDHTETIQIYYDPEKISFKELLEIFFLAAHDPTQVNRQGPDVGRQYRSAVFYNNQAQKEQTEQYIKRLEESGEFKKPVATEVVKNKGFYPAEDYHQDYYKHHPDNSYIQNIAVPKVKKFEKKFKEKLKSNYK